MTVRLLKTARFYDARGWFCETWNDTHLKKIGISNDFCQDNQSYSKNAGTLRGLHFQAAPRAQAKLVRCLRGRIFDVAVDVRPNSPTFKQWVGVELTAKSGDQLFIPHGFAHGFLTLEDDCEVAYKVDDYYAPETYFGIAWNDPELAINWPKIIDKPILSDKDEVLPLLKDVDLKFEYNGQPLSQLEQ